MRLKIMMGMALCWAIRAAGQETLPVDYAVQVRAEVQSAPARIKLVWPRGRWDTAYELFRKELPDRAWTHLADLPSTVTQYTDTQVAPGHGYEYQIKKRTSRGFIGYGYIYAGIELPALEQRGSLILLVDSRHAGALRSELSRLAQDLAGDGWQVLRADVPADATVSQVRALVRALFETDGGRVRALFLFGHIPVAYSGNIAPDDHNHEGAWPADAHYADMTGKWQWTDFTVASLTAQEGITRNVPGDGKFDQSYAPAVDLETGRVDFYNLPSFTAVRRPELQLLRQYLEKNHRFRHGQIQVPRRALMADFLPKGYIPATSSGDADPVGNSGWRNFSAFFGAENIAEAGWNEYFPTTTSQSYLWSFASAASRSFSGSDGIGTTTDFGTRNVQVVFTMFVGGFYGDWNFENNFLRGALGSGYVLTASYSGLPHWHYQHMALGQPIGFSTRLTQLNRRGGPYPPFNDGAGQVHIGLLGDPTLRMHPVIPPSNLGIAPSADGVRLSWTPSSDQNVLGYAVYRASSPHGPFERIGGNTLINGTTFQDQPPAGLQTYMVRAFKREQSASGTYINPSQGVFAATGATATPVAPQHLKARAISSSAIVLTWTDLSPNETGFQIERKTGGANFSPIATTGSETTGFLDRGLAAGTAYTYRIRALKDAGVSSYSNETQTTTASSEPSFAPAKVQFVGADWATQGTWPGHYGKEGYYAVTKEDSVAHAAESPWPADPKIPYYVAVNPINKQTFIWKNPTPDPRALFESDEAVKRIAAAWYGERFSIELNFNDAALHRVSFYFIDWDNAGRAQRVEIVGPNGALLDTRTADSFQNGVYYTWDLQGQTRVDFIRVAGPNAVLFGFFFDPAITGIGSIPAAPANLAGTALSPSEIRLTWSDQANDELGLRLERRRLDESQFSLAAGLPSNTQAVVDTGLTPGTEYVYRVHAFNESGISAFSNLTQVRTLSVPAPLTLSATRAGPAALRLRVSGSAGLRITIEWSPDLNQWSPLTSTTLGPAPFETEQGVADARRYYRARAD